MLRNLEDKILGPYETPSNNLSRRMYDNLTMPWDVETGPFSRQKFVRYEWNRNGKLEDGEDDFFGGSKETTLAELAKSLGTASMVTRWREANPELVGTEKDCVNLTMSKIAEVVGGEGSKLEDIKIKVGSSTVLLLLSRE
jgi:hypothetical protein